MKILHTSDWHLGQNFMGKSRVEEHEAFLSWLLEIIKEKENCFGGISRGVPKAISQERFIGLGIEVCFCKRGEFEKAVANYHACFIPNRYPDHNGSYHDVVKNCDYDGLANYIKSLLKYCKMK